MKFLLLVSLLLSGCACDCVCPDLTTIEEIPGQPKVTAFPEEIPPATPKPSGGWLDIPETTIPK